MVSTRSKDVPGPAKSQDTAGTKGRSSQKDALASFGQDAEDAMKEKLLKISEKKKAATKEPPKARAPASVEMISEFFDDEQPAEEPEEPLTDYLTAAAPKMKPIRLQTQPPETQPPETQPPETQPPETQEDDMEEDDDELPLGAQIAPVIVPSPHLFPLESECFAEVKKGKAAFCVWLRNRLLGLATIADDDLGVLFDMYVAKQEFLNRVLPIELKCENSAKEKALQDLKYANRSDTIESRYNNLIAAEETNLQNWANDIANGYAEAEKMSYSIELSQKKIERFTEERDRALAAASDNIATAKQEYEQFLLKYQVAEAMVTFVSSNNKPVVRTSMPSLAGRTTATPKKKARTTAAGASGSATATTAGITNPAAGAYPQGTILAKGVRSSVPIDSDVPTLLSTWRPMLEKAPPHNKEAPVFRSADDATPLQQSVLEKLKTARAQAHSDASLKVPHIERCVCSECVKIRKDGHDADGNPSDGIPSHGVNKGYKHMVSVVTVNKDTGAQLCNSAVRIHSVRPHTDTNGPKPLGPGEGKLHRVSFPGGKPEANSYDYALADIMDEGGMSLLPHAPLNPEALQELDSELQEKARVYADTAHWMKMKEEYAKSVSTKEASTKVAALRAETIKPVLDYYYAKAQEEGFLNQHVVLQLHDEQGNRVYNEKHNHFVLIPAEMYYEGFQLPLPEFEGFKMSCILPNKDRITKESCTIMFGPQSVTNTPNSAFVRKQKNSSEYEIIYVFCNEEKGILWHPDVKSGQRSQSSKRKRQELAAIVEENEGEAGPSTVV